MIIPRLQQNILRLIVLFETLMVCDSQSFIPTIVRPQFDLAWEAIKEISQVETIEDIDIHAIPYGKDILCSACRLTFNFLITSHNFFVPDEVIKVGLVGLCSLLQSHDFCEGVISLNMPIFLEIIKRKPDLTSEHVCGTVFEQFCAKDPIVEWSIEIAEKTNLVETINQESRLSPAKRQAGNELELFEIAHISDTHVDMKYVAGAAAEGCREPLCCRNNKSDITDASDEAGQWGHYKSCDVPWSTADNVLTTVANNHKTIKYVYMTGDLIAHNIWETSREENIRQIEQQASLFQSTIGKDVIIFPVLGNHEPHPANVLAPPDIKQYSGEWLYEAFYNSWCKHFPLEAKSTFIKGGYYTVSPVPGFRVIGLNSLFGYVYNWWMILDPVDPAGQLSWLQQTLLLAESQHEKVHILMHGPAAETDTLQVWRREYNKIINRFKSTVTGQFYGHTHRDQFYIQYDEQTMEPISVAWNGGSVTTFTNVNPNYRIYFVNKNSLEVEDFDTYAYNLTEANENLNTLPNWFKLYSFKEAYNIPSLSLVDLNFLVKQLSIEDHLFNKYFIYHMKNSDIAFRKECDKKCRKKIICKTVSKPYNSTQCKKILQFSTEN